MAADPKTTVCPECGGRGMVSYMTIGLTRCGQCGGSGAVATAPKQIATTAYTTPVHAAMQASMGNLPREDQMLVAFYIRSFLRALPNDGKPIPVTGARIDGNRTVYNPVDLAAYAEGWPK